MGAREEAGGTEGDGAEVGSKEFITVLPGTLPGRPSERKAREAELRQTRAFLDAVVENLPVTLFVKDARDDLRYVLLNKAGEALLGDALALVGAVWAAVYFIIGRRLRAGIDLAAYIGVVYPVAALLLLCFLGGGSARADTVSLLFLLPAAALAAGLGATGFMQLEAEAGRLCMFGGEDVVLVVVAERNANVGLIRVEMLRAAEVLA